MDGFITENTAFSLGVVAILVGFAYWLTSLYKDVQQTKERLAALEVSMTSLTTNLQNIQITLGVISERLRILGEREE